MYINKTSVSELIPVTEISISGNWIKNQTDIVIPIYNAHLRGHMKIHITRYSYTPRYKRGQKYTDCYCCYNQSVVQFRKSFLKFLSYKNSNHYKSIKTQVKWNFEVTKVTDSVKNIFKNTEGLLLFKKVCDHCLSFSKFTSHNKTL